MLLAIDVYYTSNNIAHAVGVLFNWDDEEPQQTIQTQLEGIAPYEPGAFYKRELPCLLSVINKVDVAALEAIIIDGYVYVDNNKNGGLGKHLYDKLEQKVPVIGVAKTGYFNNQQTVVNVNRGESQKPLYVSAVGYDLNKAATNIKHMQGKYRMPDILKTLDQLTRAAL